MFNFLPILGGVMSTFVIDDETNSTMDALQREADLAKSNARNAMSAGQYNSRRQQDEANNLFGAIESSVGASGTEQSSGNVLDILRQSHVEAEMDRLTILHDAQMQKTNFLAQARGLEEDRRSVNRARGNRKAAALLGGFAGTAANLGSSGRGGGDPSPRLATTGTANYGAMGGYNITPGSEMS